MRERFSLVLTALSVCAVGGEASRAHARPLTDHVVDVPRLAPPAVPPSAVAPPAAAPSATAPPSKPAHPPAPAAPAPEVSAATRASTADESRPPELTDEVEFDPVTVTHVDDGAFRVAGSEQRLDEEELERFEHDDVHSVLLSVPGVYVRGEDGYGLRPNIGLRGANSDRSKKVTLMEDGVLFGPAPYSAPAAYYFPLVTRMTRVDVIKGPASIRFGPNTIGGAVNLVTRAIPRATDDEPSRGGIDAAAGSNWYGKLHGHYGHGSEHWGLLGEAVHLRTDGFKELDGGGDTGFRKNEFMLKGRVNTSESARAHNELQVKLGYSTELSNETYLGLSDSDFASAPWRRYRASALDRMEWDRTEGEVRYTFSLDDVELEAVAYRHRLSRSWRKVNSLLDAAGREIAIYDVLLSPDTPRNQLLYDVLVGNETTEQDIRVAVGTNQRDYLAEGIQLTGRIEIEGALEHAIETGVRYHYDEIHRQHTQAAFLMSEVAGEPGLVSDGSTEALVLHNLGSTHAVSLHALDTMTIGRVTVSPGARVEIIRSRMEPRGTTAGPATEPVRSRLTHAVLPGVGAFYAFTAELGALAGVHRGFSPVSPGQLAAVRPETSVNYEAGARYQTDRSSAELIGFFNDYDNLTPDCAFSSGCSDANVDRQFAGGDVDVYGVETLLTHTFSGPEGIEFPARTSYTLTLTRVVTGFTSDNPQLGVVDVDDALPYVPVHQLSVQTGATGERWSVTAAVSHVSSMLEQAGTGDPGEPKTDTVTLLDLASDLRVLERASVYAKVDNVLGSAFIASRRPFGARPQRPRQIQVGFKADF